MARPAPAVISPAAPNATVAAAVRVRDLTVAFATADGELPAVSHVSLDLPPGQITGLLGESGSGKSTLALALLNATPGRVTSGSVEIDGVGDVLALPAAELRRVRGAEIGYVFQASQNSLNPLKPVGKQLLDLGRSPPAVAKATVRSRTLTAAGAFAFGTAGGVTAGASQAIRSPAAAG